MDEMVKVVKGKSEEVFCGDEFVKVVDMMV